jgi:hypothetical protein
MDIDFTTTQLVDKRRYIEKWCYERELVETFESQSVALSEITEQEAAK